MRQLLLKLIQKYFLKVDTKVKSGDLVCHVNNERSTFEALGIYYNFSLKPFLFLRDDNGYIFSAPVHEYKPVNDVKVITHAGT